MARAPRYVDKRKYFLSRPGEKTSIFFELVVGEEEMLARFEMVGSKIRTRAMTGFVLRRVDRYRILRAFRGSYRMTAFVRLAPSQGQLLLPGPLASAFDGKIPNFLGSEVCIIDGFVGCRDL